MSPETIRVLSIEDNPSDARLIREMLHEASALGWDLPQIELTWVDSLTTGLAHLDQGDVDVVLSDLDLPDSQAGDTFARLRAHAPYMPIVVLTGREDEALARHTVRAGADDYLFKREMNGSLLAHALLYAMERQRARMALQEAHDALEHRVQKRTAELAQANAQLRHKVAERAQAEERIARLNRVLRAIRNVNQLIVREKDPARLIQGACDNLIETRGYHNAWLVLTCPGTACQGSNAEGPVLTCPPWQTSAPWHCTPGQVRTFPGKRPPGLSLANVRQDFGGGQCQGSAEAGLGKDFSPLLEQLQHGDWPACGQRALAQAEVVVTPNPSTACGDCPLAASYTGRGAMTMRLAHGGKVYGLLCASIPAALTTDEKEQALFQELAGDIAFALHNIELEQARKRAESQRAAALDALRASEQRYKSLLHRIQAAVIVHDADTQIIASNSKAQELLRLTEDQILGKTVMDPDWQFLRADGERMPLEEYPVNQVMDTRQPLRDLTAGIYHPDAGDLTWTLVNADPVFDDVGKVQQVIVTFMDITAHKRAEEQVTHSQRLLLALSQAAQAVQRVRSPKAVYRTVGEQITRLGLDATALTLSDDRSHLLVSYLTLKSDIVRAAETLTGLSVQGYRVPLTPDGFFQRIVDGEETVFSHLGAEILAQALPRPVRRLAGRLAHLLGWQESIFAPLIIGDAVQGVLAVTGANLTASDVPAVTAFANQAAIAIENARLYQETQRLATFNQSIVQSMAEGIVVEDTAGTLTFVNPAAAALLGYAPDELVGLHGTTIVPPEQRSIVQMANERRKRGAADRYELELVRKDGEKITVLIAGSPHFDKHGHFSGTMAVFTDITERVRTESQKEAALAALEESESRVRRKLESILSPEGDLGLLELTDIIDVEAIQTLMDDFYALTNIGIALVDLRGEVLVATGWQDICTQFHRLCPETQRRCIKSDTVLSSSVQPGTCKLYKCKNHMWDMVTPIVVGGQHVGNLFLGQFFFDDEPVDRELFRQQAQKYGFDQTAYLEALERVPRWSRERVDHVFQFYTKFATLVSQQSHSNLKLARTLAEKERLLAAHKASEQKFRSYVENAPYGIFVANEHTRYVEANKAACHMTGYDRDELLNMQITQLIPPDYFDVAQEHFHTAVEQGISTGKSQFITKAGHKRWWSVSAVRLSETRFLGYTEDITERIQAEDVRARLTAQVHEQARQMEQILDTVPAGVLLLDAERRILQANLVAEKDLAELAGAKVGDTLTHLGDRLLAELLTSPPTQGLWHKVKSGGRTFEVIARPMQPASLNAGSPDPERWVLVINDVTQEREFQAQLQQQERLAAVGQLAAGIAHDFNNIMATIILYARMIERASGLSERDRERLSVVNQQAWHATRLIEQILDFSRRAVLERHPMDLLPLLKEQVKLLERTLPEHIAIALDYGRDEYTVDADPTRMRQMLTNLAVNARDAMPKGGTLHIALERVTVERGKEPSMPETALQQAQEDGEWIRLAVSDTGTGIAPDVLPHIFEPFFTTKEPGKGSGLGLAQVHGIVAQHGGHIDVSTERKKGTTFALYLPALLVHQSRVPARETQALVQGQGETILVVEDDATLREALVDNLKLLNYRVLKVANGQAALAVMQEQAEQIDLVLSDLVMPEMGGQALFHTMRQRGLKIPVLMLSGHPMQNELEALQAQGLAGWMLKPPDMVQLSQLLAQAMGAVPE